MMSEPQENVNPMRPCLDLKEGKLGVVILVDGLVTSRRKEQEFSRYRKAVLEERLSYFPQTTSMGRERGLIDNVQYTKNSRLLSYLLRQNLREVLKYVKNLRKPPSTPFTSLLPT